MAGVLGKTFVRNFSASRRLLSAAGESASEHGDYKLWKKLTFFVAFPAIGLAMVNCYLDHTKGEHTRPEFKKYEYMRIRTKPFPWGDGNHSLFHNPHTNALPDGYEDEGHH